MAGRVMNKAPVVRKLLTAFVLLLSACNSGSQQTQSHETERGDLAGARIGGPFTLTDQNGKTVQWGDFKGQYRLVYFGYTYCPDVCPLDLARIVAGFRPLEKSDPAKAAKVQPIFITVDPERDTPQQLKTYVSAFHPRLMGLTGPVETIEQVKKAFAVVAQQAGRPEEPQRLFRQPLADALFLRPRRSTHRPRADRRRCKGREDQWRDDPRLF